MKRFILTFAVLGMLQYGVFAQSAANTAIISGAISGSTDSIARIKGHPDSLTHTFKINNGIFKDTMEVVSGLYELGFGREYTTLYLEPGFQLEISADMNQFDETISYAGKGNKENTFIAGVYLAGKEYSKQVAKLDSLNEEVFVSKTNKHYEDQLVRLKALTGVSEKYKSLMEQFIMLEKINSYNNFQFQMMRRAGKPFEPSESFPDLLSTLDPNKTELLGMQNYSLLLQMKIRNAAWKKEKNQEIKEPYLVFLNTLDTMVQVPEIKEKIISDMYKMIIDYANDKSVVYDKLTGLTKNEATKEKIDAHYQKWQLMAKGNPSPDFSFIDINGKAHTLAELKGKLIYIDVWATWCQPCIAEIPELKKLVAGFKGKNIAFVSISMNDKKDKWEAMVKEKALDGLQLFAENPRAEFFEKFAINSIPRFIIIDKEGKIVDPNAKRPSNPELKKYLESLL